MLSCCDHNSTTRLAELHINTFEKSDMPSLTAFVSLLILITAAYGLAPLSPHPAINVPSSSTPSTLQLLNLSSTANDSKVVNATNDNIRCDGKSWGYNLNKPSCIDAWEEIPRNSEIISFGARRMGFFERPLPYRYLSGRFSATRISVWGFNCS